MRLSREIAAFVQLGKSPNNQTLQIWKEKIEDMELEIDPFVDENEQAPEIAKDFAALKKALGGER